MYMQNTKDPEIYRHRIGFLFVKYTKTVYFTERIKRRDIT